MINNKKEEIKDTVSLFENNVPDLLYENNVNNEEKSSFNLKVNSSLTYLFALYTISDRSGEIICYKVHKSDEISKETTNIEFKENSSEEIKNITISELIEKEQEQTKEHIETTDLNIKSNEEDDNEYKNNNALITNFKVMYYIPILFLF